VRERCQRSRQNPSGAGDCPSAPRGVPGRAQTTCSCKDNEDPQFPGQIELDSETTDSKASSAEAGMNHEGRAWTRFKA
jgi:hypothetical protein